jgi:copper homeostasis protein CutC
MSDHAETVVLRQSLTRRAFTLDAALAILAGCVITIADTACGSSTSPTPAAPADVNGVIAANHGHIAVIMGAQITAGNAVSLDIRGTATHTHTVAISQSDLTTLKNRQTVATNSTTDASHSHAITFTPS